MKFLYSEHNCDTRYIADTIFINCIFAWAAAVKLDFCHNQDPFSNNSPIYLVSDSTHMRISGHNMNETEKVTKLNLTLKFQCCIEVTIVFLFESQNANKREKQSLVEARSHLKNSCACMLKLNKYHQKDKDRT